MIDFTQCDVEPLRVYDGANGKKICVIYTDDSHGQARGVLTTKFSL